MTRIKDANFCFVLCYRIYRHTENGPLKMFAAWKTVYYLLFVSIHLYQRWSYRKTTPNAYN